MLYPPVRVYEFERLDRYILSWEVRYDRLSSEVHRRKLWEWYSVAPERNLVVPYEKIIEYVSL